METLVIIPARGGSKGLPRKNIRPLLNKPLIAHTIEQALQAKTVSRVVVSTDDDDIASVSIAYGAEVVSRPKEISGDEATSESALCHVLEQLAAAEQYYPELVVFLQCTSPLRAPDDIDSAVQELLVQEADSLLSVVPFHLFTWRLIEGKPEAIDYDYRYRPRRQDRYPEFIENGSIYVFKPWVLKQFNNRLGGKVALYVMDPSSLVDINNAEDFALCELLMDRRQVQAI